MLGRDRNGGLEVLLLRRNKALAFAGGFWVFPGGKVEPEELTLGKDELDAAKLAAIRETKEETNIDVDVEQLLFFRHWTTPAIEPRRYATYFFFGEINTLMSEVTIDDSEIKEHIWLSPQAALDKLTDRKMAMMPPTMMSLQLIKNCKSVKEVSALLSQEKPIFVLPVLQMEERKIICLYKGDAAYDSGNISAVGARHRLIINKENGTINFEFRDCDEEIRPVNGGIQL